MKYIHLFTPDENEKFSTPFYHFLKDEFIIEEHIFFIPTHSNEKLKDKNVQYFNFGFFWALNFFKQSLSCQKIIIHGIPHNIYFFLLLTVFPHIAKKSVWFIWGGDLYYYKFRNKKFKSNIVEFFRRIIIRRFKYLVTHLEGDYDLAKKWYEAKGNYIYSFMYPSNLYKRIDLNVFKKNDTVSIQIGNSACETNKHLELLESLKFIKEKNILLFCPLSYSGKEKYITKVIEKGYEIFGKDKFIPMLEFMPHSNYIDFLSKIDVTIFNHDRQRGLGNITSLLSLGKKVYIKESITTWAFCVKNNIRVFSIDTDLKDVLVPISDELKENNKKLVKSLFSAHNLKHDLNKVFES